MGAARRGTYYNTSHAPADCPPATYRKCGLGHVAVPGRKGKARPLPVSFLGIPDQQNGPPWYRSNSLPPELRRFPWIELLNGLLSIAALRWRCPLPATGRIRPNPARPQRSAPCKASPTASARATGTACSSGSSARRTPPGGHLPRRRLRRRQDPPAGIAVARSPGAQGLRHLRGVHQPGGRALLPQDGGRPEQLQAGLHRRVRTRRSGRHGPDVAADARTGRRRRQARCDIQHAARFAGRRPFCRRRLPARDPGPRGPVRRRPHRRRGLPPPWPAEGARAAEATANSRTT